MIKAIQIVTVAEIEEYRSEKIVQFKYGSDVRGN